jgi:basic amino acid/polyamine antiporter, APA family
MLELNPEDMLALINIDRLPCESFWDVVNHKIPHFTFLIVAVSVTWIIIRKELSLIPALGLLANFKLMSQLGITNWLRFLLWLLIGLVLYFVYGVRHSRLKKEMDHTKG